MSWFKKLFESGFDVKGVTNNLLSKLDDSSLTLQERADSTVNFLERLQILPSSVTRRMVTWVQLGFIY